MLHLLTPVLFALGTLAAAHARQEAASPEGPDPAEGAVRIGGRIGFPLLEDGRVFLGTAAGTLRVFDEASGAELWSFETDAPLYNRPVLAEGRLFVGGQDGFLRAFDPETGDVEWEFECGNVPWGYRDRFVNGQVTVFEGMVVFSSEDWNLYSVEAETGEELWRCKLGEEPQALEVPIEDGLALIGTWDGHLYAVDVGLGEVRWRSSTDADHHGRTLRSPAGELYWQPDRPGGETLPNQAPYVTAVPIVVEDTVYYTDWTGNLVALHLETGRQRWRFKAPTKDVRHAGSRFRFVHWGDALVFGTQEDGHLYGVDRATGEELWELDRAATILGPFDAGGGVVLLFEERGGHAFTLVALDVETREVLWTRADAASLPCVRDAVVYFGTMRGHLVGVDARTGSPQWTLGERSEG